MYNPLPFFSICLDQALDLLFTDDKLWSFVSFHMKEPSVKIPLKASAILVAANMARSGNDSGLSI